MAFNRIGISKDAINTSFDQQFGAQIDNNTKRKKNNRFTATFLLLLTLGLGTYAWLFYAPAFFNASQALGLTPKGEKLPTVGFETGDKELAAKYAGMFSVRRGYVREGQALKLDYSLSPETKMSVDIKRCTTPLFIEAFSCGAAEGQTINVEQSGTGAKSLVMRNPGFYYFQETVTNLDGSPTDKPYIVVWSRKKMRSAK